jgi:formate-dependent nitrite reductase membrane component NrfD
MPPVTRWFIKTGIIWFALGVTLALVAELPNVQGSALLLPVYWHMLVIGWITQVIMGVSIWMFPRKKRNRKKESSSLATGAYFLLNGGLIIRFLSEPFLPLVTNSDIVPVVVIVSGILQVAAIMLFIAEIWPRVQPKKKLKRKSGRA